MRGTHRGLGFILFGIVFYLVAIAIPGSLQVYEEPVILDPTYSVAQIVRPGGWFISILRDPGGAISSSNISTLASCYIDKPYNVSLVVNSLSRDGNLYIINLSIPFIDIPRGSMYPCSLVITDGRRLLIAERSVYIYNKDLDRIGLLHISDVHIPLPTPLGTAYQTLTSAVFIANMLSDVNIVVNTGDTADRPGDPMLYTYYKKGVSVLMKPLLTVPGNHDGSGITPDKFSAVYGSNVGLATWSRRIDGYLIIGLDTSTTGVIDKTQLAFLERVLQQNMDARTKIILIHHPIFRASAKGVYIDQPLRDVPRDLLYSSWASAEDIAREFLRIVDTYNVSAVLAGHVHQDSIVVYRNKTIFITTGTLGGPRSDYNAFRIIDAYSNGSVVPRYSPGSNARSNMNSYNVEKAVIRYWAEDRYSGVYINISRDIDIQPGGFASIYLESPGGDVVIERILYDSNSIERINSTSRIDILREDGILKAIYRVDIPGQEIYRPLAIIARTPGMNTSTKPSILNIAINPQVPRQGIDPIIVTIEVSRGSTFIYRVDTTLRTTLRGGGSISISSEALPSWDYSSYTTIFQKIDGVSGELIVRIYDIYGNSAERSVSIKFRETVTGTPTTQTQVITTKTVMPTEGYIQTTTSYTSPYTWQSKTETPKTQVLTTANTIATHTTVQSMGDSLGLIVMIIIVAIGISILAAITLTKGRSKRL